jgi:uncharacterized sulfatase
MNERPESLTDSDIRKLESLYDAEVRFTDNQLSSLLDGLERRGLLEETMIVVTSDHGEALGERGSFGHYQALYEELVRVPLVIRPPGGASATVEEQVGLVDIAPTVLDYAEIEFPESINFSGVSLRSAIDGRALNRPDERLILGQGSPLGLRTPRWKYIWWERDGAEPHRSELFDLEDDPGERCDVSSDHQDIVQRFDDFLADHVTHATETEPEDGPAGIKPETDEELEEQLEALGYRS